MSVGLVILLLVPPGDSQSPLVAGVVGAATRSLGADATVLVDVETSASEETALALGERLHVNAVVTLQWLDANRVALHVHWSGQTEWAHRFFAFNATDAPDERGRALGFTLAAMAQNNAVDRRVSTNVTSPSSPLNQGQPRQQRPQEQQKREDEPQQQEPSAQARGGASEGSRAVFHVSLEASAQTQVGTHATSLGAVVRGAVYVVPAVALTASAAWRAGGIVAVDGDLRFLSLAAGLRVPLVRVRPGGTWELALQGECLASRETVVRENDAQSQSRWVPGAELEVAGAWFLWRWVAAVGSLGAQINFGGTDVVVNGHTAATLSPYRGVGELGLRVYFW